MADEWVWIVWWNDNERGKSKYTEKNICLIATLSSTYPTRAGHESNQGLRGEGLATKQAPEPLYGLQIKPYKAIYKIENYVHQYRHARGTQWRRWLRYRPVSWKVAGSILNYLILLAALWPWVRLSL